MRKTLDFLLKISLALVVLMIPLKSIWGSYSLIFLGLVGLMNTIYNRKWESPSVISYMLIGSFLVRIIWLSRAEDFEYGLKSLETEFPLFAIPLIFSLFIVTDELKKFTIRIYVFMTSCVIIYSFVQLAIYLQDSPWTFYEYTKFHIKPKWFWETSRYFSRNMLNWENAHYSFLTVLILYGAYLFYSIKNETLWFKITWYLYLAITILFIVYTGSRIGFVLFVVGILCITFFSFSSLRNHMILFGTAIIIFMSTVIWIGISRYNRMDPVRYHYAVKALDAYKKKPWLGFGTGAGKSIMRDPEFENLIGYSVNHPHNQFLSELIQFGIIGSIPLIFFFALAIIKALTHQDVPYFVLLIIVLIFMMVEAPLNSNKGVLPFLMTVFLIRNSKSKSTRVINE